MQRRHGGEALFYLADEDKAYRITSTSDGPILSETALTLVEKTRVFRYGKLYKTRRLKGLSLDLNLLADLGNAMISTTPDSDDIKNKNLPAGYTYLGQFIAHDMSFNPKDLPVNMETTVNGRSPTLDLDSLYGDGPLSDSSKHLYEDDKRRLKVGYNSPKAKGFRNDLLRDETNPDNQKALIADERDDENLAVAQTHLAFAKFHNAVVTKLEGSGEFPEDKLFEESKKRVVQHYQWIILEDYLPRILQPDILRNYRRHLRRAVPCDPAKPPYMPIEFAFAAFRLGHSMVASLYNWNKNFESATLKQLFENSGNNPIPYMLGALHYKWIIDWTRFYDFTSHGIPRPQNFNFAEKIDTTVTGGMRNLSGLPTMSGTNQLSLASLNLIKGNLMGLSSGQAIAKAYREEILTPEQLLNKDSHAEILKTGNLQCETPLWYYILKEAELPPNNGERLGRVGSRIVATTFVGLIKRSRTSILVEDRWSPLKDERFGFGRRKTFEMTDLLSFMGELNPLGN